VRRAVYETMIEQLDLPVCNEHANRPMWPFFLPMIRSAPAPNSAMHASTDNTTRVGDTGHNQTNQKSNGHWYLAEDFAFCHRARQCGFPIMADTTVRLWHVGDYAYSWDDAGIDRERYGDFDFLFSE